ncbi:MAG TPA: ABC transporter permease [Puia sp.]|jgi:ABC-2 type transport system permease protein
MSKIWLIMRREYLIRVRNKTFLLSTFLLPLVIILFIAGSVVLSEQTKTRHRIAVVDANGYFKDYLKSDSSIIFDFTPGIDSLNYEQKGCTAILVIPLLQEGKKPDYKLKYKKQLSISGATDLENRVANAVTDHLIYEQTRISKGRLDSIRLQSNIGHLRSYEDNGKTLKESSQGFSYLIGYLSGILIYMLTFIYGAMVMRGVMEEKTNRIAEVVISSVKPFQLMMGKITGIGIVGLTQFLLWVVLLVALAIVAQGFISPDTWKGVQQLQQSNAMGNAASAVQVGEAAQKLFQLTNVKWGLTLICFLFYFIGGYLFYSALFAAVGSAVNEDPQEAQSLMLPITLPIIFSFVIMTIAVQDPAGPLAVWASIIPFSAPIVMMARIPFGVPWWQLGLSMTLLVLGFLGTTWLAAKIYRTGILMYGKKPSWKTMWKWAFHQ